MVPKQCDMDLGFDLNDFYDKQDMINHLEKKKRRLSVADHINYMVTESFTQRNGDRDDVSK